MLSVNSEDILFSRRVINETNFVWQGPDTMDENSLRACQGNTECGCCFEHLDVLNVILEVNAQEVGKVSDESKGNSEVRRDGDSPGRHSELIKDLNTR